MQAVLRSGAEADAFPCNPLLNALNKKVVEGAKGLRAPDNYRDPHGW